MKAEAKRTLFWGGAMVAGATALIAAAATAEALTGGNTWAVGAALIAAAGVIATKGREQAQKWWELMIVGEAHPYGLETTTYEKTTRGRKLAGKLERLVGQATRPVQIICVGSGAGARERAEGRWDRALESAARAGAQMRLFAMAYDTEGAAHMKALGERHANVECTVMEAPPDVWCVLQPVMAWSGERDDPERALFWLEGVPEEDEDTVSAEYRGTRNLRRNTGMLEEFEGYVEEAVAEHASWRRRQAWRGALEQ